MLKTELLVKIDEKAEVQATEIKTQCEQLREEFGTVMGQAAARMATIEMRVLSLEEGLEGRKIRILRPDRTVVIYA